MSLAEVERDDPIAVVTMNRPERPNGLPDELMDVEIERRSLAPAIASDRFTEKRRPHIGGR